MSVIKSKRDTSVRDYTVSLANLHEMIIDDKAKMYNRNRRRVSRDVDEVFNEALELSYVYCECYPSKYRPWDYIKQNLCIIALNKKMAELHKTILPFLLEIPHISEARFNMYTKLINEVCELSARNFRVKEDVLKMDEYYDLILEFDDVVKMECKEAVNKGKYDFLVMKPYLKPSFEECETVRFARNLQKYTGRQYDKMNEKDKQLYGNKLLKFINDYVYYCHQANLIYPLCKEEWVERADYLSYAKAVLKEYDKQLLLVFSYVNISQEVKTYWLEKYGECLNKFNGLESHGRKTFASLPSKTEIPNYEEYRDKEVAKKVANAKKKKTMERKKREEENKRKKQEREAKKKAEESANKAVVNAEETASKATKEVVRQTVSHTSTSTPIELPEPISIPIQDTKPGLIMLEGRIRFGETILLSKM